MRKPVTWLTTLTFQGFFQLPPALFEPPVVFIIRVLVISLFTRHVSQAYSWIVTCSVDLLSVSDCIALGLKISCEINTTDSKCNLPLWVFRRHLATRCLKRASMQPSVLPGVDAKFISSGFDSLHHLLPL